MAAKTPVRWINRKRQTCPDCIERGAVNLVGQPVFRAGAKLTYGCETCGGTGRVTAVELAGGYPKGFQWYQRRLRA